MEIHRDGKNEHYHLKESLTSKGLFLIYFHRFQHYPTSHYFRDKDIF